MQSAPYKTYKNCLPQLNIQSFGKSTLLPGWKACRELTISGSLLSKGEFTFVLAETFIQTSYWVLSLVLAFASSLLIGNQTKDYQGVTEDQRDIKKII